ncbi:MAG: AAA family ATPase [Oscillospiraceae bacterium]|jgi:ATP-dependent Lon protease|nr:AAA family ATPase [Oscillospiraceae bacterium]
MANTKKEIQRYLVQQKYSSNRPTVLLLNGDAGTGKTTFAKAVAVSIGRESAIISLNGLQSGSDITGLSTHYRDSTGGAISKAIIESGCFNPVIILDEIDKCAVDRENGLIWYSLLQLFDKNNCDFKYSFLDIYYDISQVIFIVTSNTIENLPQPLLDRMKIVHLNGYNRIEKQEILSNYILPQLYEDYDHISKDLKLGETDKYFILENDKGSKGIRSIAKLAEEIYIDKIIDFESKNS